MTVIRSKDIWPQISKIIGIDDSRAIRQITIKISPLNSMVELSIEEYATKKVTQDETHPERSA